MKCSILSTCAILFASAMALPVEMGAAADLSTDVNMDAAVDMSIDADMNGATEMSPNKLRKFGCCDQFDNCK